MTCDRTVGDEVPISLDSTGLQRLLGSVLAEPDDDAALALQKTLLVGSALLMSTGGVFWALFTVAFDPVTAAVPFGYTVLTAVNFLQHRALRNYGAFRAAQLLLTLLLPFFMSLSMGGIQASGVVVAWALLTPMGATLFCSEQRARLWFGGFVLVLILTAALEPFVMRDTVLPAAFFPWFTALNIGVPTSAAFILLRHFVMQKDEALEALAAERQKSDRLLRNVLPEEIAEILRVEHRTIAEKFDDISVLFADIVGFTKLSETLPPEEMIEVLNEVFSAFDEIAEKYEVEKIRTIGDNYMVAAGAPRPRDDHAHALVSMALEMNDYLQRAPRPELAFRIGINSGPAVGGVVGNQKFHYDVWGDAVNVASRMESHGAAGRIHIGPHTHELVGGEFACEPRGAIEIKGKGAMETWFVNGPRVA